VRIELAAGVHAPAAARRFVSSVMEDVSRHSGPPPPDDVVLVVSELVTNSVRAGAWQIRVALDITEERLELQVSDDATGWPAVRHADWDDPRGRGLAIVEDVADDWHATGLGDGKQVTVTWSRRPG
jgi:anti-sigma regulatory factor (Ser/Thr protein kinase)